MNSSNIPIASINVFKALEETEIFKKQEKSIELKIKLLNIENDNKRNKNAFY